MGGACRFACALAVVGLGVLAATSRAAVLFTTSSDFTGWGLGGTATDSTVTTSALDFDGGTINGAGNNPGNSGSTLGAGQTSTGGSLQLTWGPNTGNFNVIAFAPGEAFNPSFMAAIDPGSIPAFTPQTGFGPGATAPFSGTLQMIYSIPDNNAGQNGFFQLGVDLAYDADGFFQTFFPSSTVTLPSANGQTLVLATIPYTITAGSLNGFGFGIAYNSNFAPTQPFFIDSISTVDATPEPASLSCIGAAIGVLLMRRRRAA
jgi:hypothetical protein